jgi:hypothetical protein
MAAHLKFNSTTGKVDTKSTHGKYTEELLQLNEPALVKFRLSALSMESMVRKEIASQSKELTSLADDLRLGIIDHAEYQRDFSKTSARIDSLNYSLQSINGELPLPLIKKIKAKVTIC